MSRITRHLLLLAALYALALLAVGFAAGRASAQDHHPHHRDFYRNWQRPDGFGSCCNARIEQPDGEEVGDCEPTRAEIRAGQWWVWVRQLGGWLEVPDSKVIRVRNPAGQDAHLCWTPGNGVVCFSPPDTGG